MKDDDLNKKPKILFVGAFNKTLDGSVGGQLYACDALVKSEISNYVNFTFIDSTMESLPPPLLIRRAYLALKRIFVFFYKLSSNRFDSTLIFTGSGSGFIEKGCMVLIAKIFKVRTVLSPRSGLLVDQINRMKIMRWYVNFILQNCDLVLCQSQSWSNFYQDLTKLPSHRFAVIKNWIDPAPYFELPIQKKYYDQINVLFLGWVEKNKGIYDLVLAVKENYQLLSNYKFIICGKGSELDGIKNIISDNGLEQYFQFRGWVVGEKKIDVLREADIFVLPSYREGLPNALLEAMASGCAVVASSVGAIPDIIEDGKNGVLITQGDNMQLASSIIKLGSSKKLREDFGIHARKTIMSQHDINNVWKDVFDLLNKQ